MSDDLLSFDEEIAPPRINGELVFEAPWQTRAFGVTADLVAGGRFSWDDFRVELIAAIDRWERSAPPDRPEWSYYERWLEALEVMVSSRALLEDATLSQRVHDYAHRPHGHDH